MSQVNQIIKSIFEVIGDITDEGYSLFINDQNIPVLLNKDYSTDYPQIRVSPFVDKYEIDYQKYIERSYQKYRHWEGGIFQIDIYDKSIINAQKIYDTINDRLYDFFNLETLIYEWSPQFENIDPNLYRNAAYAIGDNNSLFKDIYNIIINNNEIYRVSNIDELSNNTYYVDENFLYINTNENIMDIKIKVLLQGRLFTNGDSYSDRGLHHYAIVNLKNLSALEDNEVERISFDLEILYSYKREREALPQVNKIKYPKKHHVR